MRSSISFTDDLRMDAQFFRKVYLKEDQALHKHNLIDIGTCAFVTDGPHGYHEVDEQSPIATLTAKCASNWFAEREGADTIAIWVDEANKRSSLVVDDILLSTRGTVGKCALVTEEVLPANLDQDVARIALNEDAPFNSAYLLAYLNSQFGQDHIERHSSGMVQQGLSLAKVRDIPVPELSTAIQERIATIERVVAGMPNDTPIEKRDRELIAFTAITGIRDGTLVSLKLRHFDIDRLLVLQNPLEVATKFGKRIDTFLFPLNDIFEPIFLEWVQCLREDQFFADHDPLFPQTALGHDENNCFEAAGLSREHWSTASPIRSIFKAAFSEAGLPEFTPHRFRDMIVSEMYARKLTIAEFKAWSQNLGHEGAMTTLTSYGTIGLEEQGRLVRKGAEPALTEKPLTRSDIEEILAQRGL